MDSDHPDVIAWAEARGGDDEDPVARAVTLYEAVRDGFRYDPFHVTFERAHMKASYFVTQTSGYCIEKANLLGACARVFNIPARLGFADVRNHIGTEKLEQKLGTNRLVYHGFVELFLDGRWVKATPAFNRELCERLGVPPLAFDGRSDSIFQAFSADGSLFMEYLEDRGTFADWPVDHFEETVRHYYGDVLSGPKPDA